MVTLIADRLKNPEQVANSRCFPYQLLAAYRATEGNNIPREIVDSLHDAMELSTLNVPSFDGKKIFICPDTSGSMGQSVTGGGFGFTTSRGGQHVSKVTCVDVAGLVSSTLLRNNPTAEVLPFDTMVRPIRLEPRDTVMTNCGKLAKMMGGGTSCGMPLAQLNSRNAIGDVVIYISDNESWYGNARFSRGTSMQEGWKMFKRRNPNAKLICIDIVPNNTTQTVNDKDVLNVGGFSDRVFDVIKSFITGNGQQWVDYINKIDLP